MTIEKSEYDKQAEEFLSSTNTEFKAVFLKHDKHFPDDKEERDIYTITLKRGDRVYNFAFGQSLNDSGMILYLSNGERTKHKGFNIPLETRRLIEKATTIEEKAARIKAYEFKLRIIPKIHSLKALSCFLYQCSEGTIPKRKLYKEMRQKERKLAFDIIDSMPEYEAELG